MVLHPPNPVSMQGVVSDAISLLQSPHPTWQSSLFNNFLIFILGSPILVSGLSFSGISAAFLLGTLIWRAFGPSGFLLVASYFIIGTGVTKVKMSQKEAQGIAEKRRGRRGPGSLGFVASFCTKLNDTVSSEIGKAYAKTT
ncbi:Protein VTE6, chloroplastic [Linum grandiflorum]